MTNLDHHGFGGIYSHVKSCVKVGLSGEVLIEDAH